MPVRVECPDCGKGILAPSKYRGKKIKCPNCDEPFVIPAAPSSNTAPEPKQQALPPVPPPLVPPSLPPKDFESSLSDGPPKADVPVDVIACPFCAESIKAAAKKCKHCGEFIDSQSPTPPTHSSTVSSDSQEKTERGGLHKQRILVAAIAFAGMVGVFMPWLRAPIIGTVSGMSMAGSDGKITLGFFACTILGAFAGWSRPMTVASQLLCGLPAILASALAVYKIVTFSNTEKTGNAIADGMTASISLGVGLFVIGTAGLAVFLAPLLYKGSR